MTAAPPVDLVFLWHHHQPDYRSPREGRSLLPWVRLHVSKDYLDMAVHLRRHPKVHASFNFVPSLLDQIDDVAAGGHDVLFDLLARDPASLEAAERRDVLERCALAPRYAKEAWPEYRKLCARARRAAAESGRGDAFSNDDLIALECWFLLAWVDPVLHDEPEARAARRPPGASRSCIVTRCTHFTPAWPRKSSAPIANSPRPARSS